MALTKEGLKNFVEQYFLEYKKIIDTLSINQKKLFKTYGQFPIKVIAYLTEKGSLWEYAPNSPKFEVEISEVLDFPQIDKSRHYFGQYANRYLESNLTKAQELAKRDVLLNTLKIRLKNLSAGFLIILKPHVR
jgi:hypothetical protein